MKLDRYKMRHDRLRVEDFAHIHSSPEYQPSSIASQLCSSLLGSILNHRRHEDHSRPARLGAPIRHYLILAHHSTWPHSPRASTPARSAPAQSTHWLCLPAPSRNAGAGAAKKAAALTATATGAVEKAASGAGLPAIGAWEPGSVARVTMSAAERRPAQRALVHRVGVAVSWLIVGRAQSLCKSARRTCRRPSMNVRYMFWENRPSLLL
ncbi:hypothetical protein VFPFJ_02202 [Purpureocillium lilacinum]|uniref:Uncharacterized protein n=1 Tax=Purpureocillium lilacinum TaxID=33203 RepID=A0A179HTZ3_PURLI|nr:hypothetical protein VFPFJ_02202 [Purpureocillium lilacinum]OAQ93041.1 hypothetical protein VFPFJ_02202 [Purpureocillium lilacinum]